MRLFDQARDAPRSLTAGEDDAGLGGDQAPTQQIGEHDVGAEDVLKDGAFVVPAPMSDLLVVVGEHHAARLQEDHVEGAIGQGCDCVRDRRRIGHVEPRRDVESSVGISADAGEDRLARLLAARLGAHRHRDAREPFLEQRDDGLHAQPAVGSGHQHVLGCFGFGLHRLVLPSRRSQAALRVAVLAPRSISLWPTSMRANATPGTAM